MISVDSGATGKLLCSLFQGATCFLEERQQWKAVEVPGWTSLRQTWPQLLTVMTTRYPTRPVILVELLHSEISISDISLSCKPPLCIRIGILTPERLHSPPPQKKNPLIYSHHLSGICFIPADEVFVLVTSFLWIPYFLSFISTCGSCPALPIYSFTYQPCRFLSWSRGFEFLIYHLYDGKYSESLKVPRVPQLSLSIHTTQPSVV